MYFQENGDVGYAEEEFLDGQEDDQQNGQRTGQGGGLPGSHGDFLLDGGWDINVLVKRSDGKHVQVDGQGGFVNVGGHDPIVVGGVYGGHAEDHVDGQEDGLNVGPDANLETGLLVGQKDTPVVLKERFVGRHVQVRNT